MWSDMIDHAYCSFMHAESWVFEYRSQQTQVFKIGRNRYTLNVLIS